MDVKNTITDMLNQMEKFKLQLIDNVDNVPEHPKIKRIGKSPNCFIINSKDLENNWSAEYYDSQYQARIIISLIEKSTDLIHIQRVLEEIVNKGVYQVSQGHRMYFNNQVREFIKNML